MTHPGRLVAIEGASASGKTTLVHAAARVLNWAPIAEAYDRLDPAPALDFDSPAELLRLEGALLAEEVHRYREARELRERGRTVLADTGFLGPLTYTLGLVELGRAPYSVARSIARSVRQLLRERSLGVPDLTIYLETSTRERARRAREGAGRHPHELFSRHEKVGAVERRFFRKTFPQSLPGRLRFLPAHSSPSQLVWRLGIVVEGASPTPATPTDALRFVSHLLTPAAAVRVAAPTVKKAARPARLPCDGR